MSKNSKDYTDSNKNISEYIFDDYINGMELEDTDAILKKLPLLVSNNLACNITGSDCVDMPYNLEYRVACKFIQKYNKNIKNSRRKHLKYEIGGVENVYAKTNKDILELSKYVLEVGKYYAQLGDSDYCILMIDQDDTDQYRYKYTMYFIGNKWRKYKSKFYKLVDKYNACNDSSKIERIYYTNKPSSQEVIFKPFENVIFKDKEKVLAYIDNWVNNIPIYYEKYQMVSRLSIMIHGEPGTGKTTFGKALAKYLGIPNIISVSPDYFTTSPIGGKSNDRSYFMDAVYSIDDIDCVCKSRELEKDRKNDEVLSSLLSFLDNPPSFNYKAKNGVRYPVSIIVATTNYYDKLDDAVKRYGRFDLKMAMDNFDKEQAQLMCDIYDLKLSDMVKDSNKKDFTISPSYLQALCLENIDNKMKEIK